MGAGLSNIRCDSIRTKKSVNKHPHKVINCFAICCLKKSDRSYRKSCVNAGLFVILFLHLFPAITYGLAKVKDLEEIPIEHWLLV